jgi:hypothetical protein
MTTSEKDEMRGAPPEGGALETFVDIEMRPAGSGVELYAALTVAPVMGKVRSFTVPDKDYAPVHLETSGKRWIEHDGPTFLYTHLGTQGGLEWFFPELPDDGSVGATTTWEIAAPDAFGITTTEAARGHHPGVEAPTSGSNEPHAPAVVAHVRLERWTEDHGVRVAELSMSAKRDSDSGAGEMRIRGSEEFRGTYAVLASGRLLRAEVERDASIHLVSDTFGVHDAQQHTQHTTRHMNLVEACDGPTASSLVKPLTREERAIHTWGEAWLAFMKDDRDALLAAIDPALRRKHGDAKLWAALKEIQSLRGNEALPAPVMLRDDNIKSDGDDVRIAIPHGSTHDPTTTNTQSPVEVTVVMHETDGRFTATSLTGVDTFDKYPLFDISVDRVRVRHGWPPK